MKRDLTRFAMLRPKLTTILFAFGLLASPGVLADICKYLDSDGRTIYSNLPVKGAKRLSCDVTLEPASGNVKAARNSASPADFPKVNAATQKSRDDLRRKVLEDELVNEEKFLAEARKAYRGGAPEQMADEGGNEPKYRERVGKLKENVAVHEKNIAALKQELAKLR